MKKRHINHIGFATNNVGKLQEAVELLQLPIVQLSLSFSEPQEIHGEDISAAKAITAYSQYKIPVFADHTSLYIDAWNNFPGGLIGTLLRQVGDTGLLKMMTAFTNKSSTGQTAIAFCDGPSPVIFTGDIRGSITLSAIGYEHTGWDRIFVPEGYSRTYGEMTLTEKNAISQRRIALNKFKHYLLERYDFSSSGQ